MDIAPTQPNNVMPTVYTLVGLSGTRPTLRSLRLAHYLALRSFNRGDRDPWPFQQRNMGILPFPIWGSVLNWDSLQIYIVTRFESLL